VDRRFDRPTAPWVGLGIASCLAASALALVLAPLNMPDSYNWVEHTTSESAAQGVEGAWVARAGFVLFGLTVLWLSHIAAVRWQRWGTVLFVAFGVFMVFAAAFSSRSWETDAAYDRVEDVLHSIAATGMGFAFALGVLFVALTRGASARLHHGLDATAIIGSVLLPLGMSVWDDYAGVLQRAMFVIAYAWFAVEVLKHHRLAVAEAVGAGGKSNVGRA
jgi:hypothetical protein